MPNIFDDLFGGIDPELLKKFMVDPTKCAKCGADGDLRPWPPRSESQMRYCGGCRLKLAVDGMNRKRA